MKINLTEINRTECVDREPYLLIELNDNYSIGHYCGALSSFIIRDNPFRSPKVKNIFAIEIEEDEVDGTEV